jgi:O-antigen/teichoic acid export membrane protein
MEQPKRLVARWKSPDLMASEYKASALTRRLVLGTGSGALSRLWIVVIQLITVPIMVSRWGVQDYGIWLMLTTLPAYIALGDLGFGMAASADMTRDIARENRAGAISTFQSVWVLVSGLSVIVLLIAGAVCLSLEAFLPATSQIERIMIPAAIMVANSLISLQINLYFSWYQSTKQYALGTLIIGLTTPVEGCAQIAAVVFGAHFLGVAVILFGLRVIALVIVIAILKRRVPWISLGWKQATIERIRELAHPALAALSMPVSNALNIQGSVLVVGSILSPTAAAMFGTLRTVTRVPLQVVGTLSRASLPEITTAHALGKRETLNSLTAANLLAVTLVALPAAFGLLLLGQTIVSLLTHGHILPPIPLLVLMTAIMVLQTLWNTTGSFLFSLNLQHRFTHTYAILSLASTVMCIYAARSFGIVSVAAILLLVDCIMVAVTMVAWRRASGTKWGATADAMVQLAATIARRLVMWRTLSR